MRERDLIDWIRNQTHLDPESVPVGPGDDAAVVRCGGEELVVTVDQVLDTVHFSLDTHGPEAAGRKAMARNLSDLAAMAAEPMCAVASVALERGTRQEQARAVYNGIRRLGDEFGCPLVGGDVSVWDGPLGISLTAIGRLAGRQAVLRSGARAGDAICVTGTRGGAWRGDKHLTFTPRVREALELADRCDLHAMIDISDGLARDLWHVCEASGVAAEIRAADLPLSAPARATDDPVGAALEDGEDYELLFCLPADQARGLLGQPPAGTPVSIVGTIGQGEGITLVQADGTGEKIDPGGWEHQT
jgi:thiamine-monophosphate kinase